MKTGLGRRASDSSFCTCVFMSEGPALIRQLFKFDLFQRGASGEQTRTRPRLAACLRQCARNFIIYSPKPIRAALPRMQSWKHLHCKLDGVSALTLTETRVYKHR